MHSKDPNVRDVESVRPGKIVFPQRLISPGIPAARILRRPLPRTGGTRLSANSTDPVSARFYVECRV